MKNLPEEFELNDILEEFQWQKENSAARSETFDFDSFLADEPVWEEPAEAQAGVQDWVDFVRAEETAAERPETPEKTPEPVGEAGGSVTDSGEEAAEEPAEPEEPEEEDPVLEAPPRPIVFVEPVGGYDDPEPPAKGGRGWWVLLLGLLAMAAVAGLILLLMSELREPLKEMLPEPIVRFLSRFL